jgi:diphthamide biosynthesis methyltransferase
MFYIIGLGLADEKDITIRGLEVIRKPKSVWI